ncbi:hypothetical protein [Microvirga makkahensis]|uniref:Uncharacterized protein n=1 Tax=Microvirga makkahensis TaxID=1128670 RepID=A0A7X3MVY2_9HYPH|nr:hypothetical protein [Microvirga makkahensis]MXQ14219.1 hypothetical protein [Microvirga makkahensis]
MLTDPQLAMLKPLVEQCRHKGNAEDLTPPVPVDAHRNQHGSRSPSGLWLRRSLMAEAAGLSLVLVTVRLLSKCVTLSITILP